MQKRFRFGVPYLRDRRSDCEEPPKFVRCTRPLRACILLTHGCGVTCTCVRCVSVCTVKTQPHTQSCALRLRLCLFSPALFALGVTIAQGSHLLRLRDVCMRMFACYKSRLVMQVRSELVFWIKMSGSRSSLEEFRKTHRCADTPE